MRQLAKPMEPDCPGLRSIFSLRQGPINWPVIASWRRKCIRAFMWAIPPAASPHKFQPRWSRWESRRRLLSPSEPVTPTAYIWQEKYGAAAAEYQALSQDPEVVGTAQVNKLLARAAVATFKQTKHVNPSQLVRLSDTDDEAGATRLYLMMETARDAKDVAQVKALIGQLEQRFPTSRWTAEALFSAGNMALVANDMPTAIQYYGDLAKRFPDSAMASTSHWHAAWLNYRLGDKRRRRSCLMSRLCATPMTRISLPQSTGGVWSIRKYEKNPAAAAACYQKLIRSYRQYYYSDLAKQRLDALGAVEPATLPQLAHLGEPKAPDLTTDIPEDDVHVERAKLLANAGLNQYIVSEIGDSPDSTTWSAYAEAQLYSSYGEELAGNASAEAEAAILFRAADGCDSAAVLGPAFSAALLAGAAK